MRPGIHCTMLLHVPPASGVIASKTVPLYIHVKAMGEIHSLPSYLRIVEQFDVGPGASEEARRRS